MLTPTEQQRDIIEERTGLFAVRACPGSGKTFTVAARLNRLLASWPHRHQGIAVASFTNVAWREVAEYLTTEFKHPSIAHPHFLGTLDSFINRYVFLPFGHLVMPTSKRPELTGPPHNEHEPIGNRMYWGNSDCNKKGCALNEFTYDGDGNVIRIGYPNMGHRCAVAGQPCTIKKPIITRWGLATQSDAIHFALKLLKTYPDIAKALAYRFPVFMIDEAQDTSTAQMEILDLLVEHGLTELMLVGDPDQAIYEWREAEPLLFHKKCEEWKANSTDLNENWRSSQHICNAASRMASSAAPMQAVNPAVAGAAVRPEIRGYNNAADLGAVVAEFLKACASAGIDAPNRHVLTRSKEFMNDIAPGSSPAPLVPWADEAPLTGLLAKAKYLFDQGQFADSMRVIERAVFRGSESFSMRALYPTLAKLSIRGDLFALLEDLPPTGEMLLGEWTIKAQAVLASSALTDSGKDVLKVKRASSKCDYPNLSFSAVFGRVTQLSTSHEFSIQTIHSAKGTSLDAVLIPLKKKGSTGAFYVNMLRNGHTLSTSEELRIVYVGATRAKRVLWLLVPDDDIQAWTRHLLA